MPENPFTKFQKYVDKPGRSSNDLSYDVNGTYAAGKLYPVGIWDVNPGESFRIKSAFGLKFLPMPYPIQTRMRANLYYYYVRNRNMCDGWKDFIYQNKSAAEVPAPTINRPATDREFWKTGGIMDHLGCPTVLVRKGGKGVVLNTVFGLTRQFSQSGTQSGSLTPNAVISASPSPASSVFLGPAALTTSYRQVSQNIRPIRMWVDNSNSVGVLPHHIVSGMPFGYNRCAGNVSSNQPFYSKTAWGYCTGVFYQPPVNDEENDAYIDFFNCVLASQVSQADDRKVCVCVYALDADKARSYDGSSSSKNTAISDARLAYSDALSSTASQAYSPADGTMRIVLTPGVVDACERVVGDGMAYFFFIGEIPEESAKFDMPLFVSLYNWLTSLDANLGDSCQMEVSATSRVDIADYPEMNPFAGPNPKLPLSAYPLRCYESIYNAWFRNERLEPLMINGQPEYNKFCPNTDNGPDAYPYTLHSRNWESDFLTTALPSPQQGIAPVVGVTGLSNIQVDDDGTIRTFQAEVAEDGETIVGGSFTEPGASAGAKRTIADMITAGFTINDLRNVNALQRWVENNIRRGLKYRDQVLANTGVKVRYDELDMPEFIGGFSRPVNVSAITQTAPGGDAGVGDYAGQANAFGESKHSVSHYCDEAGFIMAILCIVPEPVYSQLLPKYFLRQSPLDYHHPAFNHIGMQPITYAEVCPLQVYAANPSQQSVNGLTFNDVFGYQRPWYDLLAKVNEVHGLMRTSMRDYVMNRTFDDVPELGADFIHIDPAQVNDVFSVTLPDMDICMGQIIHQCYAKRPISLFGQPKLQ